MFSKYQELITQTNKLQEELAEIEQSAFVEGAKELFQKHSELDRFSWVQYAPSFNDGDPCYFSVHRDPYINGYDWYAEDDGSTDDEDFDYDVWVEQREKLKPLYDDVTTFLEAFSDDSLARMFGEGSRVIVKRKEGIEVNDYYD